MLIGLYRPRDPLVTMPKERIQALAQQALAQDVKLVFFSSKNVNTTLEQINGKYFDGQDWVSCKIPYPDVMINELPALLSKRDSVEKKIRARIHCTTYLIGGKADIYEKVSKHSEYKNLVIPSFVVNSGQEILDLFDKYDRIVLKPTGGRQGKGIYFITRSSDKNTIHIKDHTTVKSWDVPTFTGVMDLMIKDKKYIAQPYVECRTKQGEPYDFRVHVQRRGDGNWAVTKTYPRMGAADSILSNISRGGRTQEITHFLEHEFGQKKSIEILEHLHATALGLAKHINSFYRFKIDELGIDLAIDTSGNMWLYEANTGPQTRYHEAERAVHTIAYAKYLAVKHQKPLVFDASRPVIAALTARSSSTVLMQACHQAALAQGANFYYFNPSDVIKDSATIYGYVFEGAQVRYKELPLPHAIYDRIRGRGFIRFNETYQYFDKLNIPFSHQRNGGFLSKAQMLSNLEKYPSLHTYLIPSKKITSIDDVYDFLSEHSKVIIKPLLGMAGRSVTIIEKTQDGLYRVNRKKEPLTKDFFNDLVSRFWLNGHLIQKYIESTTSTGRPFDIRVHLIRDSSFQLKIADIYARMGAEEGVVSNISAGGYIRKFEHYLEENHNENREILRKKIFLLVADIIDALEDLHGLEVPEFGLDIGLDKDLRLYLFEYNINSPGVTFHEYEVANLIIPYLIEKGKEFSQAVSK